MLRVLVERHARGQAVGTAILAAEFVNDGRKRADPVHARVARLRITTRTAARWKRFFLKSPPAEPRITSRFSSLRMHRSRLRARTTVSTTRR